MFRRTKLTSTTLTAAFGTASLLTASLLIAPPASAASAEQALEDVKEMQKKEYDQQSDRMVQVEESAIYGLAELPPTLMSEAYLKLTRDPDQSKLLVLQSANILQALSALGDGPEAQQLKQQSESLRDVAWQIGFRQLTNQKDLKPPFAKATLAAAAFQQASAARGLEMNNEEQLGYSLKGASAYTAITHAFLEKNPDAQVSRAVYDASTVGEQIISNSLPTTYAVQMRDQQGTSKSGVNPDQQRVNATGDAKSADANIPAETNQIIADLGEAIQSINLGNNRSANAAE